MKVNAFNVTTTHELMASRLRNQSMEEAAKATTQHASVQKTETQKQPTTAQKKSESASTASSKDGVYIQDVNGKLWKTEDWDNSVKANAIAVITPEHKFRIALREALLAMHSNGDDAWEDILHAYYEPEEAITDYDGVGNTKMIVDKLQASSDYAAGWCAAYTFPDGTTKGYLPALGELYLAYQNKRAIDAALLVCGGFSFTENKYLSSTFFGSDGFYRGFWRVKWRDGFLWSFNLFHEIYVRPFAPLEI